MVDTIVFTMEHYPFGLGLGLILVGAGLGMIIGGWMGRR